MVGLTVTDHDLDRRVAEIVGLQYDFQGDTIRYSEFVDDAIAALEAMREKQLGCAFEWRLRGLYPKGYECMLFWPSEERHGLGETLPLAICRAICATQEEKP